MDGYQLAGALITTLLGGGLIGAWLKYKLDGRRLSLEERREKRETERVDFDHILALVTRQRDEAYRDLGQIRDRFELLELELQGLRLSQDFDPFPGWIVDLEGRYIFVNREFEKQFLEPRGMIYRDLIGKGHEAMWPESFCLKLKQLDAQARRRPDGRARATTVVEGRQVTVHKFPMRIKAVPVAYAGYITDIEDITPSSPSATSGA